jgi:hypothetical protein
MSTHYFHVEEAKRKGIIQNPNVKKIVEDGILQAYTITKGHLNSPTNIEKPWHVMSQDTITWWYVVPKPYTMYACCSYEWAI